MLIDSLRFFSRLLGSSTLHLLSNRNRRVSYSSNSQLHTTNCMMTGGCGSRHRYSLAECQLLLEINELHPKDSWKRRVKFYNEAAQALGLYAQLTADAAKRKCNRLTRVQRKGAGISTIRSQWTDEEDKALARCDLSKNFEDGYEHFIQLMRETQSEDNFRTIRAVKGRIKVHCGDRLSFRDDDKCVEDACLTGSIGHGAQSEGTQGVDEVEGEFVTAFDDGLPQSCVGKDHSAAVEMDTNVSDRKTALIDRDDKEFAGTQVIPPQPVNCKDRQIIVSERDLPELLLRALQEVLSSRIDREEPRESGCPASNEIRAILARCVGLEQQVTHFEHELHDYRESLESRFASTGLKLSRDPSGQQGISPKLQELAAMLAQVDTNLADTVDLTMSDSD